MDRQGKMDAADREYRQAVKESGKDADVLNDYGYFLYTRDDLARAEELLQLALGRRTTGWMVLLFAHRKKGT